MNRQFEQAKLLHRTGRLEEAETGYRAVVAAEPANADALNMLGNVLTDQQRWAEARDCYRRAIAAQPDKAAAHYNLGNALAALGELPAAAESYRRAIAIRPGYGAAYYNLGNVLYDLAQWSDAAACYRQALEADGAQPDAGTAYNLARALHHGGRPEEALAYYRQTIEARPEFHTAHEALGLALVDAGHPGEALPWHRRAVELAPQDPLAHLYLGRTLTLLQQFAEAEAVYRRVLELDAHASPVYHALGQILDAEGRREELAALGEAWLRASPSDPEAIHFHAAWTGRQLPARAADEFVRAAFDGFADNFDSALARMDYRAPQLLQAILAPACATPQRDRAILDAGCGTGLCGPLLRPWAARLVGVDLSAGMLAQAQRRGLYDELVLAELTEYLRGRQAAFDVIVSADTLVYFGDLVPMLTAAGAALRPGGWLAFTVEHLPSDAPQRDFQLHAAGRYAHSEPYVRQCLERGGLIVAASEHAMLRRERGQPVAGLVVLAKRPEENGGQTR